jgi:hypothetical protein
MNENKNYNVTTSISNPIEYYKILILQRLNDLVEAWETYFKGKNSGTEISTSIIHARTVSLYLSLYAYLKRKSAKFTVDIDKKLFDREPTEKQLREIYVLINEQLDIDRLTRFDTKTTYDGTLAETENKHFGL